jgi:mannose/fructose/N-acetylgalactosamine-specific phosphotransferase system component IIC
MISTKEVVVTLLGGFLCGLLLSLPFEELPLWQCIAIGLAAGGLFVVVVKLFRRRKPKAA